jgi:hypothetical protein
MMEGMEGQDFSQMRTQPDEKQEVAVVDTAAATVTEAPADKAEQSTATQTNAQTIETKTTEVDVAAERERLKAQASEALQRLKQEADQVNSKDGDPFRVLDLIPGSADLTDGQRAKDAYRAKINYFHPDKANIKVKEILDQVGSMFPELNQLAGETAQACLDAAKTLNNAGKLLEDDKRRVTVLAEQYGIFPAAEPAVEKTTQRTAQRTAEPVAETETSNQYGAQTEPEPVDAMPQQTWNENFDRWEDFMNNWDKFRESARVSKPPEQRKAHLVEHRGKRILAELIAEAIKTIQEAIDAEGLKLALEDLIAEYKKTKAEYWLPTKGATLPLDLTVMTIEGFTHQLDPAVMEARRKNSLFWSKDTPADQESYFKYLVNCAATLVDLLKPKWLVPIGQTYGQPRASGLR